MDNFRRPKRRQNKRTLEGFLASRPSTSSSAGDTDFNRPHSYRPPAKVDDFKRPEGFQPINQSTLRPNIGRKATSQLIMPTSEAEVPKVEELKKPRGKWRLFSRKHRTTHGTKKRRWKKRTLISSGVVLLVMLLGVGFILGKGYLKARNILEGGGNAPALNENVETSQLKGEGDGRVNILLLGRGGAGHEGPDLTDTILIASIDPTHKEAALLSIPRDLYVKSQGGQGSMKINSVFANAKYAAQNSRNTETAKNAENKGMEAIQDTVGEVLGIPIHYHVIVDFEAFRKAIDTVGGVTVDVKEPLYDATVASANNGKALNVPKGQQTFDGKKALLYARSRMGSTRGDFDRAERQRQIIVALKDKVFTLGTFGNPLKISQLIDAFGNNVKTDLSEKDVMRLYTIGKTIPSNKITSLGLADPPNNYVTTSTLAGQSVVVPRAGLYNYSEIHNYVRNALKDGYIRSENASITVLNGTSVAGLATTKATELKSYGYLVGTVADAPTKNYQKTVLVDLRNGAKKYTQHYLEKRFGVTAVKSLPAGSNIQPGTADFVIILGQDAATTR